MKKFKFLLQPVLGHRERIEDEKQQALALCQRELKSAQEELARLNGEFKRHAQTLRDRHASLSSDELHSHYAHLEYLDRRMVMQHALITQRSNAVNGARRVLIEASKDRKVMEKLKERRFEEHRAAQASADQKELDDSNSRRHGRAAAAANQGGQS